MVLVLQLLAAAGFAMLVVAVHEHGHALAARAAGVPRDDVRVDLDRRPPVVLLRHGEHWVAPDDELYREAFARHRPSGAAAWAFVMAGVLVESAVTAAAVTALLVADLAPVARVLALTSAALFAAYLLADLVATSRTGRPYGDHSAAWSISRRATAAAVVAAAAVKAAGVVAAI